MGGKAFGFEAKRMDLGEYEDVLDMTLQRIKSVSDFDAAKGVISVKEKDSFGDIDILVVRDWFSFDAFWERHKYRYKDYVKNGGVYSLLDKQNRQIDLITTPRDIFNTHFNYLAYNDFGNFVGRLAKGINLKYGHDGLHLIVRQNNDKTRKVGEILIQTSTQYIYNMLDVEMPVRGFNNMQEVYEAIMASKYYHKDLFLLEKQTHKARVRDRKRKSYNEFIGYIKAFDKTTHERRRYSIYETLTMDYMHKDITWKYVNMLAGSDRQAYNKTLFNGHIVEAITGLQGKQLGAFISRYKDAIDLSGDIEKQVRTYLKSFDPTP